MPYEIGSGRARVLFTNFCANSHKANHFEIDNMCARESDYRGPFSVQGTVLAHKKDDFGFDASDASQ
jgi:hypothetical protein